MNKYAYPWDDEIMAECRQRKAELLEEHGVSEGLSKYLDERRPCFQYADLANLVSHDRICAPVVFLNHRQM
jgi:hypothetical protein